MPINSKSKQQNPIEVQSDIDYNRFKDGSKVAGEILKEHHIGNLDFPNDKVIASDPAFISDAKPYTKTIIPGSYPLAIFTAGEYKTNALAKLTFSDKPADKWVLAYTSDDARNILDGNITGIAVDTGQCCIVDEVTTHAYNRFVVEFTKNNPDADLWDQLIEPKTNNVGAKGRWSKISIPNSQHGFYMFHSGYGDGTYPAYWGMAKDGEVVSFIIDFDPHR